jgi:hypothetical protein
MHPRLAVRRGRLTVGAAMIETILVMPLLLVMLSLILFFGWNFKRLITASSIDRYEAWRLADHAPGPSSDGWSSGQIVRSFMPSDEPRLDRAIFDQYPTDAPEQMQRAAGEIHSDAGPLAQRMIDELPLGSGVRFSGRYATTSRFWERLSTPIRHDHVRLDGDWRFANGIAWNPVKEKWEPWGHRVAIGRLVREELFSEFDNLLDPYVAGDNALARSVREFYTSYPGYSGPELPLNWTRDDGWTY